MGIEKLNESLYRKFELNEKLDDKFESVNFYEDNLEDCDDDVEDCDEDILVECDPLDEDYQFPETDYFNITENLDDYDGNILTEAEAKKAVDDEKNAAKEKAAAERKERFALMHKLFDKHMDNDPNSSWIDTIYDLFDKAESVTFVGDKYNLIPRRTEDDQPVKYRYSEKDYDFYTDPYRDIVYIATNNNDLLAEDLNDEFPEEDEDDFQEIEEESLTEANENPNEDTDPEVDDDDVYPYESLEEIIEKYLTAIHDAMMEGYINIDQEINNVEDFEWVFHKCYRFTEDENDRDFYRYINDIYKAWVNNGEQDEWNEEYWYQHEDDIEESLTEAREYDGLPDDMWTFMYDAMFEGPRARPAILDYARNYISLNFDTDNYASNKSVSRFIGDDPRYDVAIGVKGQSPEELEFAKEVFDKCKLENTGIEKVNSDSRYPYRIVAKIPTDKNGDPIKTKDYFASMGEKKPVRKQNIPSKTYGTKKKNESYDSSDWELVKTKSVYDLDGFLTEYSMWYNKDTGAYNFIFGDSDIYTPDTADFDWEDIYDKDLADEWFDNYDGFGEEDEY